MTHFNCRTAKILAMAMASTQDNIPNETSEMVENKSSNDSIENAIMEDDELLQNTDIILSNIQNILDNETESNLNCCLNFEENSELYANNSNSSALILNRNNINNEENKMENSSNHDSNEKELESDSDKENKTGFVEDDYVEEEGGEEEKEADVGNLVKTRRKRRHANCIDWKKNSNAKKREKGQDYLGKKKDGEKWKYNVKKTKKVMKERCTCRYGTKHPKLNCHLLTEADRQKIFDAFWSLQWSEKKLFVEMSTERGFTERPRNRNVDDSSRRTYSYKYFLKKDEQNVRVCKKMFSNTLGMTQWTINHWLKTESKDTVEDGGSKAYIDAENNDKNLVRKNFKKEHLIEFFNTLAKVESHYCRSSSSKLYLEPIWISKSEVYQFYKNNWCPRFNEDPLSIATFSYVFEDMNLSLFKPKKDECDVCIAYKTKNLGDEEYRDHIMKKDEARLEKDNDKKGDNEVYTMDLQSVLLCPRSNVSSLYYKTKLIVHNFTIYNLKTQDGYCFLWHEGEGGLSANIFASIICTFLAGECEKSDKKVFILYSDGCTCQNRNATLSNALLNLSMEKDIIIIQKYLEKGHTQMECDSMHSTIERKLRHRKINVPADYAEICRTARKNPRPYNVLYLNHTFFKSFNHLMFVTSIRPGSKVGEETVTDIRALCYNPVGCIDFKIRHGNEWQQLPKRINKKINPFPLTNLPQLYAKPLTIKKDKYQHLMDLKKSLLPDYHQFYDSLLHE